MNFSFEIFFGVLSGIFGIFAYIPYVKSILTGKYPPERVTWWTWFTLDVLAFKSSMDSGATLTLILMGAYACGAFSVAMLSVWRGVGGATLADKICIAILVINFVLIFTIGYNPSVMLILTITAGMIGSFPTFRQAWRRPQEIPPFPWILFLTSTFFSFLTITEWGTWQVLAIPVAFSVIQLTIAVPLFLLWFRSRKKIDSMVGYH